MSIAEQFEENEQYDKAYEQYKKDYEKNPKSIDLLQRLGHIATILEKKEEATDFYKKILELDPTSVLAYEQLMDIYVQTDRYKYYISRGNLHVIQKELSHAINDFKKALNKAQEDDEINATRFVLANLYKQIGKNHLAIDEYLKILDTNAVNEEVFIELAKLYLEEDLVSSSIETLERARNNGFDTDKIKNELAKLYLKNNTPQKARELSNDVLVKIRSYLDEEKNQEAFNLLNEIQQNYKKNPKYHSLFAQYYFNNKEWEKSLEEVNEFDKFEKNSPLTFQMKALIFEEQGNEFEAHICWAKYNLIRKDSDVALNEYLSAYQLEPQNIDLLRDIAELYELSDEKNNAIEFWEKLANIDSNNKKALQKVAEFKQEIGDYRGAIDALEKLHEINKNNSMVLFDLAQAYEKVKNKGEAIDFYKKFIETSPINEKSNFAKERLNKLENSSETLNSNEEGLIDKIMRLFSK